MPAETKNTQLFRLLRFSKLAALSGGFLLLLLEIRFQHRAALIDDWRPWMPIVFCNIMIYLIPIAGIFWRNGGKQILFCAYFLTIALGATGVYFHSEGHLIWRFMELTRVWLIPPSQGAEIAAHYPPVLAPLSFMGLGLIGMLFCFENGGPASASKGLQSTTGTTDPLILAEIRSLTSEDPTIQSDIESKMSA
ncbi:MAG: hypothetical protein JST89_08625 [Cyanobacteria bacterium SZAS-4]|nr:hypothetical protein [Cyanobacteria bacterium SZAS-4]